jgi:hypothetical protein
MLVPSSLLRQQATIEPYQGNTGRGPVWGEPVVVRCRFEGKRRVVRRVNAGDSGSDVISSGSVTIRPGLDVPTESRVTISARTYEVLDVIVGEGLTRPAYIELMVG